MRRLKDHRAPTHTGNNIHFSVTVSACVHMCCRLDCCVVFRVLYFAAIFCRQVYENLTTKFSHFCFGVGFMEFKALRIIGYDLFNITRILAKQKRIERGHLRLSIRFCFAQIRAILRKLWSIIPRTLNSINPPQKQKYAKIVVRFVVRFIFAKFKNSCKI